MILRGILIKHNDKIITTEIWHTKKFSYGETTPSLKRNLESEIYTPELKDIALCEKYPSNHSLPQSLKGIYFLYHNDELIYIGKSTCIKSRLKSHINKFFNFFSYVEIPQGQLSSYERAYINKFLPGLNIDVLTSQKKQTLL